MDNEVVLRRVQTQSFHAGPFSMVVTEGNDYAKLDLNARITDTRQYRLDERDLTALLAVTQAALHMLREVRRESPAPMGEGTFDVSASREG